MEVWKFAQYDVIKWEIGLTTVGLLARQCQLKFFQCLLGLLSQDPQRIQLISPL